MNDSTVNMYQPFVDQLAVAGDWSALVRFSIAHDYVPALDRSIDIVSKQTGRKYEILATYLNEFRRNQGSADSRVLEFGKNHWAASEVHTFSIMNCFPVREFLRQSESLPPNEREDALRAVDTYASKMAYAGQEVGDYSIAAFAFKLMADALAALGDRKSSMQHYDMALRSYRVLNNRTQEIYRLPLARTLESIGLLNIELNEMRAAAGCFGEGVELIRPLASSWPQYHRSELARLLVQWGNAQAQSSLCPSAIVSFRESIQIYEDLANEQLGTFLPDLATARLGLGSALAELVNLPEALEMFEAALEAYRTLANEDADLYGPDVAAALNNIGNIQQKMDRLDSAVQCFEEAIEIYSFLPERNAVQNRIELAMVIGNLGIVQRELKNYEAALDSHTKSLATYVDLADKHPNVYRLELARAYNNRGLVYRELRNIEAAIENFGEAIRLFEEHAQIYPEIGLLGRSGAYANLGHLNLFESESLGLPNRAAARDCYRKAIRCTEQYRGQFTDAGSRGNVQLNHLSIYEDLFRVCVELCEFHGDDGALREAIEVAEGIRARNLVEMLADETLQPANTPPELVDQFREVRRELRQATRRLTERQEATTASSTPANQDSGESSELQAKVDELRRLYSSALSEVRHYDSEFDPDEPVPPSNFELMQSLLPTDVPTAVVHFSLGHERGVALVMTSDGIDVVSLPELNDEQSMELGQTWFDGYYKSQRSGRGTPDEKAALLEEMATKIGTHRLKVVHDDEVEEKGPLWAQLLPELLEPVTQRAIQPVVNKLKDQGIERLILVPNRALHLFPLHACKLDDGQYLGDVFEVVYTPSLSILHRCAQRQRTQRESLLAVENPTLDLPFTGLETSRVRRQYDHGQTLRGPDASKQRMMDEARDCHVWQYSGHATFDPADPLASALVLGSTRDKGQWLTLRDIFCNLHLRENQLVAISGCESGMLVPDRVDEYVGLPSGFLYAGASCVVSSLWFVNDLSTALLMDKFHALWNDGHSVSGALREASRWLRDEIPNGPFVRDTIVTDEFLADVPDEATRLKCRAQAEKLAHDYPQDPPFASPFYWAPFIATGMAYAG